MNAPEDSGGVYILAPKSSVAAAADQLAGEDSPTDARVGQSQCKTYLTAYRRCPHMPVCPSTCEAEQESTFLEKE
jgi:hypothetical protein